MRRFLFRLLAAAVVAYATVLAGAFMVYALEAMAVLAKVVRPGIVVADVGLAIGAVLAGLGALVASVRYLITPTLADAMEARRPKAPSR